MKIIYTRPDGSISVVHPAEGVTVEELMARSIPPDATNAQVVEDTEIPTDRTFRNAWTQSGSKVAHDITKCREIVRAVLREKRAPLMAALDVEYMRADEAGNAAEKLRIAAEKQKLRDITKNPAIDAATKPEDLKPLANIPGAKA